MLETRSLPTARNRAARDIPPSNQKLAYREAGLVDRPHIMRRSLQPADNAAIIEGQFGGIILQGKNRVSMGFLSRLGLNSDHIRPFKSKERPIKAYLIPCILEVE